MRCAVWQLELDKASLPGQELDKASLPGLELGKAGLPGPDQDKAGLPGPAADRDQLRRIKSVWHLGQWMLTLPRPLGIRIFWPQPGHL